MEIKKKKKKETNRSKREEGNLICWDLGGDDQRKKRKKERRSHARVSSSTKNIFSFLFLIEKRCLLPLSVLNYTHTHSLII